MIRVSVAYARPDRQEIVRVSLSAGATLRDAIEASGLPITFPEIDLARDGAGVFGRRLPLEAPLADGDRVEIYRPLLAEPKTVRRDRAQARAARKRTAR